MRCRPSGGRAHGRPAAAIPARAVVLASVAVVLATACLPKFGEVEFDGGAPPRYLLPVLASAFSVADALGDNDFDGTLTVTPGGDYLLTRADTVIEQAALQTIELPPVLIPLADTSTVIDFGALGIPVPITRLDLAAAQLEVTLANPRSEAVEVTLTSPNFVRAGQPLSVTAGIAAGGTLAQTLDFGGGSFVIADGTVGARYDARLPDGRRVVLGAGAVRLVSPVPSLVVGNATDVSLPIGRFAIATDFLGDFSPGQTRLREASIDLAVGSEVTADASARAAATFAVLRDGSRVDFSTPFGAGIALEPAPPGGRTRTELVLDGANSDLVSALERFPDSIVFEIDATLNPGAPARPFRIDDSDSVRLAYEARVPLAVAFEGFTRVDTVSLPALGELERISAAELLIVTDNGIPLRATVSGVLLDGDDQPVAELLVGETTVLRPAAYDADARQVSGSRRDTVAVAVAPGAIPLLRTAGRAALRITLDTEGAAGFVQLRPDQSLRLEVGLDVTLERER